MVKSLLAFISISISAYFMYVTNSALGSDRQFGLRDEAIKVI